MPERPAGDNPKSCPLLHFSTCDAFRCRIIVHAINNGKPQPMPITWSDNPETYRAQLIKILDNPLALSVPVASDAMMRAAQLLRAPEPIAIAPVGAIERLRSKRDFAARDAIISISERGADISRARARAFNEALQILGVEDKPDDT